MTHGSLSLWRSQCSGDTNLGTVVEKCCDGGKYWAETHTAETSNLDLGIRESQSLRVSGTRPGLGSKYSRESRGRFRSSVRKEHRLFGKLQHAREAYDEGSKHGTPEPDGLHFNLSSATN